MPRYRQIVATLWQMLARLGQMLARLGQMLALLGSLVLAGPVFAATTHIAATLLAESGGAPGSRVTLAILMQPSPGWHGYWSNPGDAGFGMRLDWTLPAGASAGALLYPVPETLLVSGLMNHVYQRDYALLVPLTLPVAAPPGTSLPLRVKADWLACTEQICVPEHAILSTTIPVSLGNAPKTHDPRFDGWRALLPAPLGADAAMAVDKDSIRLAIPLPSGLALAQPHVFAGLDRLVDYAAPQSFARRGDLLLVSLKRARFAALTPASFPAVLRLNAAGDGVGFTALPGAVPSGGIALAGDAPQLPGLPWLLLGALAGGVLLNVMPCVFPILSLKAISLARAGTSAAHARAEGLAYAAGVVLACLLLGGGLLSLRAGGEQIGWAFQLQQPAVVAALLALAAAITANLLGLFEFAVPGFATAGSPRGAFATGLLAAFVATPCTGPFMAGAMGAALLLPVLPALLLFAALGVGIALPFIAIAVVPALRRALPRPGRWMVWFRKAMAVPMALTALALAWLASRLGGWDFAGAAIALTAALLTLLAWTGREQRAGRAVASQVAMGGAVLLVLGAFVLPPLIHAPSSEAPEVLPAQPFSEAALAAARASGHPIFAFFTADWCLTCKVNERLAIEREDTRSAFARAGVVVIKGDWTRRDAAITRYLTGQGAAGVPLYVWYPAGFGPPRQLPQVLSPGILIELAKAGK
ncbi:MAG: thioredoxin family protein [Pseudomonadota bacterium]|nr:thioredoxin family protein [Pseudomonadota bacterium]